MLLANGAQRQAARRTSLRIILERPRPSASRGVVALILPIPIPTIVSVVLAIPIAVAVAVILPSSVLAVSAIRSVNHTTTITASDPFCLATARRRRLLTGWSVPIPHTAFPWRRHVSRWDVTTGPALVLSRRRGGNDTEASGYEESIHHALLFPRGQGTGQRQTTDAPTAEQFCPLFVLY